jgi:hypothetical protein
MANAASESTEHEVVVPKGANAVAVRVRDQEWIALAGDAGEIAREQSGSRETTFVVLPGTYRVATDGTVEDVRPDTIAVPTDPLAMLAGDGALLLRLSSDAPDRHVVDGVGEIPADGESSCTITVEKIDATGKPLRRRRDTDEVFLRSTGGTITAAKGDERIRSVKLRSGRAAFRLVSEPASRLVAVSALGSGSPAPVELPIEFV